MVPYGQAGLFTFVFFPLVHPGESKTQCTRQVCFEGCTETERKPCTRQYRGEDDTVDSFLVFFIGGMVGLKPSPIF